MTNPIFIKFASIIVFRVISSSGQLSKSNRFICLPPQKIKAMSIYFFPHHQSTSFLSLLLMLTAYLITSIIGTGSKISSCLNIRRSKIMTFFYYFFIVTVTYTSGSTKGTSRVVRILSLISNSLKKN